MRALAEVAPNESEAVLDTEWVDRTQKLVKAETDRLEHELKGYKNNLIKESIRVCTGDFPGRVGSLRGREHSILTVADGKRGPRSALSSDRRSGVCQQSLLPNARLLYNPESYSLHAVQDHQCIRRPR